MSISTTFPVIRLRQPIGELYLGSVPSEVLWNLAEFDMREIKQAEDGIYLATGVQRRLDERRADEIATYVQTVDATFPTAVVLAISAECVIMSEGSDGCLSMTLQSDETSSSTDLFSYQRVARVIDGQHRIEGLRRANKVGFDVNVAILVDADIEDQARVFAIVNLAQTKVSKSLVYDLFSYSTTDSPEKIAHGVCIALDQAPGSPLWHRIKRLGTSTPGRTDPEPLSQATVVEGLLSHIVSNKRQLIQDRDAARRGKTTAEISDEEASRLVLRRFFIQRRETDLAELMWNYFQAVAEVWPIAWQPAGTGRMLPRTNGFRALIRFFKPAYTHVARPGDMASVADFKAIFLKVPLSDRDFSTDNYPPGTSGETRLFHDLSQALR